MENKQRQLLEILHHFELTWTLTNTPERIIKAVRSDVEEEKKEKKCNKQDE